jgi:hypothetical protein
VIVQKLVATHIGGSGNGWRLDRLLGRLRNRSNCLQLPQLLQTQQAGFFECLENLVRRCLGQFVPQRREIGNRIVHLANPYAESMCTLIRRGSA